MPFVGSVEPGDDPVAVGEAMRAELGFSFEERQQYKSWTEALRRLIDLTESVGVLVMVSGIVGSNTHRKLDTAEFRGFALADSRAPLVFINGADSKAAQIFTLAHELAHIWCGRTGVDRPDLAAQPPTEDANGDRVLLERWCNAVAAEFLVPAELLPTDIDVRSLPEALSSLARTFKVSTLVVLRRLQDAGLFSSWQEYRRVYEAELARVQELGASTGTGGDFYNTQPLRVSRRFARAVISDTLEGQTLHREAFDLLGVRKPATFQSFGEELGVA